MTQGFSGQPVPLDLEFEPSGTLEDPSAISLAIWYGTANQQATQVAGPFTYSGASSPVAGEVWRTGAGLYSAVWPIPASSPGGVYTAEWTCTYNSVTYVPAENFTVRGGLPVSVPAGDTGFWTGGLIYGALDIEFGTVDANGISWLWQKLEGWDSPPVQGAGVIPKSGDHGAWASPQYFAARTLTWTITASAPTQALRDQARALLQQAVPISDLATLRYDEPIPKLCYARRSGQITEAYPTLCDVTFTVGLVAPDPHKYAAVQQNILLTPMPSGGGGDMVTPFHVPFQTMASPPPASEIAVNSGNFGSPPVVVFTGPVTGPQLTNVTTGETVSWSTLTLPAGQIAVVDFLNRQTWLTPSSISTTPGFPPPGGTYWPADLSSAWWDIEPGENAIQVGGQTGAGCTAQVFYSSAWI